MKQKFSAWWEKYELTYYGPRYALILALIALALWTAFSPAAVKIAEQKEKAREAKIVAEYGRFLPDPIGETKIELFRVMRTGETKARIRAVAVNVMRKPGVEGPAFTAFTTEDVNIQADQVWQGEWCWWRLNPGMYQSTIILTKKIQ